MVQWSVRAFAVVAVTLVPLTSLAQSTPETRDPAGLRRLESQTGGAVDVSVHKATGAARFVRLKDGAVRGLGRGPAATLADKQQHSRTFFRDYARLLGISDVNQMQFLGATTDVIGETHLSWKQTYRNVPVFGSMVRTHFGKDHQLKAVAGTAVPDITVNPTPSIDRLRAERGAIDFESAKRPDAQLRAGTVTLYVYRQGLAQGVPGENLLAWQIEVTNGAGIRQLVYVDAHSGKVIDSISGIHDELNRRAFNGLDLPRPPDNYPHGDYWSEGEKFPTASIEANNMILASEETHAFFKNNFGRDSFDGRGGIMDAIFNRGYDCPNASWNGTFISFCPGLTTDDITAHEWGHAYTQYTHDLIYQWQPGALNESYSDIWGETVDLINRRGTNDNHGLLRGAETCSTASPPVAKVLVNAPASIGGTKLAQSASFGRPLTASGITANVVAALDADEDGGGPFTTLDGCSALINAAAVNGNIALINRGSCDFSLKVFNAQSAGAVAVIIANNVAAGLPGMGAGQNAQLVTIPSVGILQSDGAAIRTALGAGTVNTTLLAQPGTDNTVRWLMGEDDPDGGALRDMHNPNCYGDPGKVTDRTFYVCDTSDEGGVHTNSGIPNHAFALLVDGGSYNGRSVGAIGLTKAAHIYYRAQSVYQVFDSDFADHAAALRMSCRDLTGTPLAALSQDFPAGEISSYDCAEVDKAIAAVELETAAPCAFAPLLNPAVPVACSATTTSGAKVDIFSANFESGAQGFTAQGSSNLHTWILKSGLPAPRTGAAFFAPNTFASCNDPAANDSSLTTLTSAPIALPARTNFARATFDHWVATEPGWDGGNLKISVNGGPFQLIPPSAYSFNGHNVLLFSAAQGNTNPLAGQPAWSGNNAGTVNGGSWGTTLVNLAGFARAGDTVRLRWDFGTDICSGRTGWYMDNVNVFSCTPKVPVLTVNDPQLLEGNSGRRIVSFVVSTDTPTLRAVSVNYSVADGTATHGDDFLPVDSGTVVIPAGATATTIGIVLKGDTLPEGNEHFFVNLSGAVNATIGKAQGRFTIVNDDVTTTLTTTRPED
jgi:Zn-dependent metalloprotease